MPADGRIARNRNSRPAAAGKKRMYAAAKVGRLAFNTGTSSADQEIHTSLRTMRNRSRALVRDVVYAKRAKTVVVNNVIGQGVGLQCQVKQTRGGRLHKLINSGIERAWDSWSKADSCHTGGTLHFSDLERLAMGEVFEAGEVFIRLHYNRFGDGKVPLSLEIIEAERIADDHEISATAGAMVTMGIEHDNFGRPIAYHLHKKHPNAVRLIPGRERDELIRVPASDMIHLRIVDRWPQARGVPALHAAISRLNQLGEFEDAALVAARIGASKVGFFEASDLVEADMATGEEPDGTPNTTVEAGEFTQLPPGYSFSSWDPSYPHENFDPFTRAFLRGISAGVGPSYESLSRDYSQSNYSSSRLALLDDRDLWRVLQQWWIRSFRDVLHRKWMQQAVMGGAINEIDRNAFGADTDRFCEVRFKPRGWGWVDPTKEVKAYKEAELAGYTTKADIIAATAGGADIEDVIEARRAELDMLAEAGLTTDTTVGAESVDQKPKDGDQEPEATSEDARLRVIGHA